VGVCFVNGVAHYIPSWSLAQTLLGSRSFVHHRKKNIIPEPSKMFFSQGTSRNPTAKAAIISHQKRKSLFKLWNKHQDLMIHTRRHHHQAMERNTNKVAYNLSLENQVLVQKKPTKESGDKSFEHKRSDGGEGSGAVRGGNPSLVTAITSLL